MLSKEFNNLMTKFSKYQGTGNDFIIIDNRDLNFDKDNLETIRFLCGRKFGIGSDGLILIEHHTTLDFNMVFYNPDGSQSFCGNGSRCAVSFAQKLGMITDFTKFNSTDGYHEASIKDRIVSLKMHDVENIEVEQDYHYMNTGSPHYNIFCDDVDSIDLVEKGREVRYNNRFKDIGTNVNFIEVLEDSIKVRTYERGVEDETLSCGTGVTACALSYAITKELEKGTVDVKAKGGDLQVSFVKNSSGFENVWLTGAATFVFKGEIELND